MPDIDLNLETHCIESAVKQLYKRLLSEYFQDEKIDNEFEENLALLQQTLSSFNFPSLRAAHAELAGNSRARIVLSDRGGNLPSITINGKAVDTKQHVKQ